MVLTKVSLVIKSAGIMGDYEIAEAVALALEKITFPYNKPEFICQQRVDEFGEPMDVPAYLFIVGAE